MYLPIRHLDRSSATFSEVISSIQSCFEQDLERINLTEHLPVSHDSLAQICNHMDLDVCLQKVADIILRGWPDSETTISPDVFPYYSIRDELVVQNGLLFKGERVVVPNSMRVDILHKIHHSHLGINGCLRRARESLYWPGMNKHVKEYIQSAAQLNWPNPRKFSFLT